MGSKKEQEAMINNDYPVGKEPWSYQAKRFIYNRDNGAFMGRTASSWAKIWTFYIIFYACLAALFALCMLILYYTLDPRIPKYRLEDSLIGTSPGMGFRPMPNDSNSLSTLIWYRGTGKDDYKYWVDSIQKFLEDYRKPGSTPGRGANIQSCDFDIPVAPGKVCGVDVKSWYPCTFENFYSYHYQAPCIFIKLNRVYGWKPEYYNDVEALPDEMPTTLKEFIRGEANKSENYLKTVWVSCEGESPADVENLGPVHYLPRQGFPGFYFPYENSEGYLSPLVAVHLQRPKTGILINIECRAWAKNIIHNRKERRGSVHFELMID
ncbi:sodium/potassium-transporting ATPase subunit beta-2 [Halyomorpha halys]|uniref:sodium/potassium-transporting ATPase subunit beta-2 n=1 Tax=Halyomorpha halys TaxID=286706 RepID=UPI0006D4F3E2|nr:sodium/potassium-transporting ATPase subunit beta-2 [Halyomorpha halys]